MTILYLHFCLSCRFVFFKVVIIALLWSYYIKFDYTGFALSLRHSVIQSFQNIFITLFLGTVRPRRLKLGTHVDSGQMYRVYWNQAAAAYSSLYFFGGFSLQFSNIKIFFNIFSRQWWNFIRPCKHIDILKINIYNRKIRVWGQFFVILNGFCLCMDSAYTCA